MIRNLICPLAFVLVLASWNCKDGYSSITLSSGTPTYNQNFDGLASSGTMNTAVPTDWAFSDSDNQYIADDGTSVVGSVYSYGTNAADRAFGSLGNGGQNLIGAEFRNGDSQDLLSVAVNYNGELWRSGAANTTDTLAFEYSTNATSITSGTWTSFTGLNYTRDSMGALTGQVNGNANQTPIADTIMFGTPLSSGSSLWMRWVDLGNQGNTGNGLAVDDFEITGTFAVPEPTTFLMFGTLVMGGLGVRRRK